MGLFYNNINKIYMVSLYIISFLEVSDYNVNVSKN